MLRLARIVGFAHRLRPPIVHRDLKPANVLVKRQAGHRLSFKIADFGIGGLAGGMVVREASRGGGRAGVLLSVLRGSYTPLYASPQQIRGEPPDPRDDVYSLGVIWYQLLTVSLSDGAPTDLDWPDDLKRQGMSDDAVRLLASCFSQRPDRRPADAATLAEMLAALVKGKESLVSPTPGQGSAAAEIERPRPVEVTVPGTWYCRPKVRATDQWVKVLKTPSRVLLRSEEVYKLKVDWGTADDYLAGLAHLAGLAGLQSLDLSGTAVTDAGLAHLAGLTGLQALHLHGCKHVTDAGLAHLRGLNGLQALHLHGCKHVTDAGLAHLAGLTALQALRLHGCKHVTDAGLAHLRGLTARQALHLNGCERVTDAGLAYLRGLTGLQSLELGFTAVTDVGLAHLRGLTARTSPAP